MRIIFHIDVNNAYLSWHACEELKLGNPIDYRTLPAIIGGDVETRRGIVLAKSFLAKAKGVTTGEPIYQARRKCPGLKVIPPRQDIYQAYSKKMFDLILNYSPDIETMSVDECYLDYTKVKSLYGDYLTFAYKLKDEIKNKLGFSVNIGISDTKLGAKMASDFQKPDRVHTLFTEEIKSKMWPLPVSDLYMTGRKSVEKLNQIGINTIGDLANFPIDRLKRIFKSKTAILMHNFANGIDNREVEPIREQCKSISQEMTLERDFETLGELNECLKKLSFNIAYRLRKCNLYAYTIGVHLKNHEFKNVSRQRRFQNPANNSKEIYEFSKIILEDMYRGERIRLIGLRATDFTSQQTVQYSLFESIETTKKDETVERLMDSINEKYGDCSIGYANTKGKNKKTSE